MKNRFNLFQRSGVFYCEDTTTGKQTSLRTRDRADAVRLLHVKNEAMHQPAMNLQIAQVYLQHGDPGLATRTWQDVMTQIASSKHGSTQKRWQAAVKDKALDSIRQRRLIETNSEHFLAVLKAGAVATNVYLRRIHHFAVAMHWLPWPVLPKLHWPPIQFQDKRAITLEEHRKILAPETDAAKRAYYELLWHLGAAQTDMARLTAEDIDWQQKTIAYQRCKTGRTALIAFGEEVAALLKTLPEKGYLFPALAEVPESRRARMFSRRLKSVGISGVTLHSYRYAWAERAKAAGYPERFAMQALGQSSKAVHRAYAKRAEVTLPALEDYGRDNGQTVLHLARN
ncbi:MAG: tyrosine-type recombinase/integrase [Verrucomicrobiae bacterium]|nr:tyrosine-type recombinase/integrase [Verrucomicrobiae bacterium]